MRTNYRLLCPPAVQAGKAALILRIVLLAELCLGHGVSHKRLGGGVGIEVLQRQQRGDKLLAAHTRQVWLALPSAPSRSTRPSPSLLRQSSPDCQQCSPSAMPGKQ